MNFNLNKLLAISGFLLTLGGGVYGFGQQAARQAQVEKDVEALKVQATELDRAQRDLDKQAISNAAASDRRLAVIESSLLNVQQEQAHQSAKLDRIENKLDRSNWSGRTPPR